MRAKISANRFEEFGFEARRFLSQGKKKILFICAVFLIGVIVGIVIGATTGVKSFCGEFNYGSGKLFLRVLLVLSIAYFFILFSSVNFIFIVLANVSICLIGGYLGRCICILSVYGGFIGILNIILIYIPVFIGSFIFMMIGYVYAISNFPLIGCRVWKLIKPILCSVGLMFLLNLLYNAAMIFILGLILDVIVI
ncbi:MAG: hypothetical protein ACI4MT_03040 [Christensenellales bacterium]